MMLESIENRPLVYPTVKEEGQIQKKKYAKLTKQENLQDDCDVQAIKIVLQGLPPDVYALVNHKDVAGSSIGIGSSFGYGTVGISIRFKNSRWLSYLAKAVLMANLSCYDPDILSE
nr:hypothetical protein [Tanacetum cinerariifolium]